MTPFDKAKSLTQETTKKFSRRISQEEAWEHAFGAVEQLSEIARAHQLLLMELLERIDALETRTDAELSSRTGNA